MPSKIRSSQGLITRMQAGLRYYFAKAFGHPHQILSAFLLLSLVAVALYSLTATQLPLLQPTKQRGHSSPLDLECLGWRATRSCTYLGERWGEKDADCNTRVWGNSGYCECTGGWTVPRSCCSITCPVTCTDACRNLKYHPERGKQLPHAHSCSAGKDRTPGSAPDKEYPLQCLPGTACRNGAAPSVSPNALPEQQQARIIKAWQRVQHAAAEAVPHAVEPPAERTAQRDWVKQGVRLSAQSVATAQAQWRAFAASAPPYPDAAFAGRGIVILGGGSQYMVPALLNVQLLRNTGCALAVEMFFLDAEYPTPGLEAALTALGVACRRLQHLGPQLAGFGLKVAALLLSRFEEVLYLDSDCLAVRDPTPLFAAPEYSATGTLLWPDYWVSSAAPDLRLVLGLPRLLNATHESGQMVLHKRRVWRGLMLAAFFNLQARLYQELMSNFMGKGDKEMFPYGLYAEGLPFHRVRHAVGSVGLDMEMCGALGCGKHFAGNTMSQHDMQGRLLFLHTNMYPKFNLELPASFSDYTRRWQVAQPGNVPFALYAMDLGPDIEQQIYELLGQLRCTIYLKEYNDMLHSRTNTSIANKLQGFHPVNGGVDFRRAYRWGFLGTYREFTKVGLADVFFHLANVHIAPLIGRHI